MTVATDEIRAKMIAHLQEAQTISAKADDEGRDYTTDERQKVFAAFESAKGLKAQLDEAKGSDDLRKALAEFGSAIGVADGPTPDPLGGRTAPYVAGKTLGERVMEAPEFSAWLEKIAPAGEISEKLAVGQSPAVGFKGLKELGQRGRKALVTGLSETSAGALVTPMELGLADQGLFQRPLTIRDVVTVGQTGTDQVRYVRETAPTNAAAPVAEATATAGASGTKPESAFGLEAVTENVRTIAHWLPATKRALSDAGQIRTLIDQFLEYGLEEELEDQMISGSGAGENFSGILTASGVQQQAWDTDIFVTTRKAKTKVRVVGRTAANAYLLHPNDWERFDLARDLDGRFHGPGPFGDDIPRLWRLPVIESEAVPEGTGICANFRFAVLWDREQAGIQVSDSHADFFVRNMVAILAELRAAFGIVRPSAFVEMDLTA